MKNDVTFQQRCPVCGRALQVSVVLLGRRVYCQHCGGGFTAMDESMRLQSRKLSSVTGVETSRSGAGVPLEVVDRLLARASATLRQAEHGSAERLTSSLFDGSRSTS
jgi:hypothetical protein